MFISPFFFKAQLIEIIFTDVGNVLGNGKTGVNKILSSQNVV